MFLEISMKQDKYLGYWLIKGTKNFIKVFGKGFSPRWREVKKIVFAFNRYFETFDEETVDWIRINCEKVTEDTFKKYTKGKL